MWYTETLYPDIKLQLKGKLLYRRKTPYQDLRIYRTQRFGNTLVLDGATQTTEGDEFIYHEMITHPVMLLSPNPQKVLVIGGGDGGVIREVVKYKTVKEVYLVEIDQHVITASKKYLKTICKNSFRDRRVKIIIDDGAKFLRQTKEKFDIVIVDSPDPIGCAKILFSKKFYQDIFSVLKNNGLMIRQAGSTILQKEELKENWQILKRIFPYFWLHLIAVPTYIGGLFTLIVGSKKIDLFNVSIDLLERRMRILKIKTNYYNPYIHMGSAMLPEYVKKILR